MSLEDYIVDGIIYSLVNLCWMGPLFGAGYLAEKLKTYNEHKNDQRIVVEDSKAYYVNKMGKTNYFRYNGKWYEPITNKNELGK